MTPDDREYIRSLPLLLVGGILFTVGTLIFYNKGDTTASVASMTLSIVLITVWATMTVQDGMRQWRYHDAKKELELHELDPNYPTGGHGD